jgi:catechol 2,3-dioxygenase-like lactoylglutathione lyase family enzyme
VLITHLALTVRDPDRSRRFYLDELGLEGSSMSQPWGHRVDLGDGFMLALIRGEPSTAVSSDVHFGCALADREAALATRRRLLDIGVREVVWEDTDEYVGVKVLDPDGYVIELAYEPRLPS